MERQIFKFNDQKHKSNIQGRFSGIVAIEFGQVFPQIISKDCDVLAMRKNK